LKNLSIETEKHYENVDKKIIEAEIYEKDIVERQKSSRK
jgi:hypothetical protein